MKINYLKLNNIGPYFGEHYFNLNTSSLQNIILIGGKNGAGKTTFLKSIKYGLFGCFSMGFKNETSTYFKEIESFINNKAKKDFYIEISFDIVEDYKTHTYLMKREWRKKGLNIDEFLYVYDGNYCFDVEETKEFIDKLRAITSPNLINSFIFDGEKISNIIENDEVSTYLEEVFNSIFNIDLIRQTEKDISNYLTKKAEENDSKAQIESVSLLNKIGFLKSQIKSFESELINCKKSKSNLLVMRKSNTDKFNALGGLEKKQQQTIMAKISILSKEKEEMSKVVKTFIENDLPLYIVFDMLKDVQLQLVNERYAQYPSMILEIASFLEEDLSHLYNKVSSAITNNNIIHNVTFDILEKLNNRLMSVEGSSIVCSEYLKKRISSFDEYKTMKKMISNNENIIALDEILEEIKKIDLSVQVLDAQISDMELAVQTMKNDLALNLSIFEKMTEDLKKTNLYDSSFVLANDSLSICDMFSKKITERKLKLVSKTALTIFNDTIRKNDYISNLEINNDFELIISDNEGSIIDPKIFSAGEMQILVSSLIWAMFKISGRREMFIFDTPLARLDTDNRLSFISKIISTISSQVVVLSTDSEFVGDNLSVIDSSVYKKYLLTYNESNGTTRIEEDYFGGAR